MTDIGWVELLVIIAAIAFLLLVPKRLLHLVRRLRRRLHRPQVGPEGSGGAPNETSESPETGECGEGDGIGQGDAIGQTGAPGTGASVDDSDE